MACGSRLKITRPGFAIGIAICRAATFRRRTGIDAADGPFLLGHRLCRAAFPVVASPEGPARPPCGRARIPGHLFGYLPHNLRPCDLFLPNPWTRAAIVDRR